MLGTPPVIKINSKIKGEVKKKLASIISNGLTVFERRLMTESKIEVHRAKKSESQNQVKESVIYK